MFAHHHILYKTVNVSDVQLDMKEKVLNANNVHVHPKIYFSGALNQLKLDHQPIQQTQQLLQQHAQNLQLGMMSQNNVFIVHYQTSLLLKLLKKNGNVLVMLQENLSPNLMELKLVNDFDLFKKKVIIFLNSSFFFIKIN